MGETTAQELQAILEAKKQTKFLGIKFARVSTWKGAVEKNRQWNKASLENNSVASFSPIAVGACPLFLCPPSDRGVVF